jgi:hypothetical protein
MAHSTPRAPSPQQYSPGTWRDALISGAHAATEIMCALCAGLLAASAFALFALPASWPPDGARFRAPWVPVSLFMAVAGVRARTLTSWSSIPYSSDAALAGTTAAGDLAFAMCAAASHFAIVALIVERSMAGGEKGVDWMSKSSGGAASSPTGALKSGAANATPPPPASSSSSSSSSSPPPPSSSSSSSRVMRPSLATLPTWFTVPELAQCEAWEFALALAEGTAIAAPLIVPGGTAVSRVAALFTGGGCALFVVWCTWTHLAAPHCPWRSLPRVPVVVRFWWLAHLHAFVLFTAAAIFRVSSLLAAGRQQLNSSQ